MPKILKNKTTKALQPKVNGRSADITAPNYIYSCLGGCRDSYCYTMRNQHAYDKIFIYDMHNHMTMTKNCFEWIDKQQWPKEPFQTDPTYYVVDLGCNTDIPLMWKYINWQAILEEYEAHPKAKASFATKYPSKLNWKPNIVNKTRVRISMTTPQMRIKMENGTDTIGRRYNEIKRLYDLGYEVHLNLSPIILYKGVMDHYKKLFDVITARIPMQILESIKLECIFLTHNKEQHQRNILLGRDDIEEYLWKPKHQEQKQSTYAKGMNNYRYNQVIKPKAIEAFKEVLDNHLPMCKIRYIF